MEEGPWEHKDLKINVAKFMYDMWTIRIVGKVYRMYVAGELECGLAAVLVILSLASTCGMHSKKNFN